MRYAVLSDIHANRHALDAVLADAQGAYDQLLYLGDIVGYGAFPSECCELLQSHSALRVLGNHDAAALGWERYDEWNPLAVHALDWTRDRLSLANQRFLEAAGEAQLVSPPDAAPFWITHANLEAPYYETYILTVAKAFDDLEGMQSSPANLSF